MKKIFYTSIIVFTILFASCTKDLNQIPISAATTATFYKQPLDFIQGTNAAYNNLRNMPDQAAIISETRSDNIYGVSVTVRDWDPLNDFSPGIAANSYVEAEWANDFSGIYKANTILGQLALNGSFVNSVSLATRLQAEATFLRAFYYFDLVKYYGGVPIVSKAVSADEANVIPRSAPSEVYKMIIADLQYAMSNLPTTYTGIDVGRATKWAAEGLLAQVYMARSGPTYSIAGPGLASNEWSLAMPLIQDIINNGGFVFNPNYTSIFSFANQNPTVNKEAIFDVMYVGGANPVVGATFVWDLAPQNYFNALPAGNSIAEGTLEIIPVSQDLFNSYEAGDTRKALTINSAGYTFQGSTETRPFFKKYLDITQIPKTSRFDWSQNFIWLRYTDILMMKAECILNGATGGTQADVDAIVNQVRARAGLPAKTGVTLAQLFDERRREFADEGTRWFDLQRSGNLLTIMNAWIAKEDVAKRISAVTANYILYPVPQSQLDAKPGLYIQNPGY